MEKFKSDHHELEVVQYTKPGDLLALLFSFWLAEFVMPIDYLCVHLLLILLLGRVAVLRT